MPDAPMRVALVTGSGKKRVGRYVAEALARAGFAIALHYRRSASEAAEALAELRGRDVNAEAFPADLTVEAEARGLVRAARDRFGRIDVLVNCAAIWPARRLEETTAADLRLCFDANVVSTFVCSQEAGLAMVAQPEGGCIITFGDWSIARPYRDHVAYLTSKGAIPALTRALAVELGSRNPKVRVNGISPGPVMLPPDLPAAEREAAIRSTLVQREGRPENVAQAVLYLVENDFVTGTMLTVDGGRTIYAGGT